MHGTKTVPMDIKKVLVSAELLAIYESCKLACYVLQEHIPIL